MARDAVRVIELMLDHEILRPVLPEISVTDGFRALVEREAEAGVAPSALRRLAALLPPASVEGVGARLKLSNAERKRLANAAEPAGTMNAQEMAYRLGTEGAVDRLLLSNRALGEVTAIADWPRPALPVSGGELVALGLDKGPVVARTRRAIEDRWIEEGFPDGARVSEITDEEVAQALRDSSI